MNVTEFHRENSKVRDERNGSFSLFKEESVSWFEKTNPVEDGSCTGCTKLKFGIFPFVCKMRDKGTIERESIWKKLSNRTSKSFAATLLGTKTM